MSTFVIADAHGRADLVLGLLQQEDLLVRGSKNRTAVIQVGDLANCVLAEEAADFEALALVRNGLIDTMLVGNHEHPYFGGPEFSGFFYHGSIKQSLTAIRKRGGLKAAYAVDDILITHAGMTPWAFARLAPGMSAEAIAMTINNCWEHNPNDPLFSTIGAARGGWQKEGGILWADWSEPKPRNLRQLFGHTVGENIRRRHVVTCIDLGAGKWTETLAGAWIRDGVIDVVTYTKGEAE